MVYMLVSNIQAVNIEAVRLLKNLGYDDVNEVYSNIGCEQEFFAIPRELAIERSEEGERDKQRETD